MAKPMPKKEETKKPQEETKKPQEEDKKSEEEKKETPKQAETPKKKNKKKKGRKWEDSIDNLAEKVEEFIDHVQPVNIAALNGLMNSYKTRKVDIIAICDIQQAKL